MTTDFRALCVELLRGLDENRHPEVRYPGHLRLVMASARAALADEPAVPTVMEIVELSSEIEAAGLGQVDFARAVLTRWGNPAPVPAAEGELGELVPVPVSERPPGPEDCAPWPGEPNAGRWCWMASCVDNGWAWEQRTLGFLASFPQDFTHWLPATALPLPGQETK